MIATFLDTFAAVVLGYAFLGYAAIGVALSLYYLWVSLRRGDSTSLGDVIVLLAFWWLASPITAWAGLCADTYIRLPEKWVKRPCCGGPEGPPF